MLKANDTKYGPIHKLIQRKKTVHLNQGKKFLGRDGNHRIDYISMRRGRMN